MSVTVIAPGIRHLRCDNPGPMTLSGTNSYVVRSGGQVVVVDPGPRDAKHGSAIVEAVGEAAEVDVLLTHHHDDHEGGAEELVAALRAATGGTVRLWGGDGGAVLRDGACLGPVQVLLTPGHTADSAVFLACAGDDAGVLFSGDTVLGGSSSFIAHPDGDLTAYLLSLDALEAVLQERPATMLAPGHGSVGGSALDAVRAYVAHRRERLAQVEEVLRSVPRGSDADARLDAVIAGVYPQIDPALRPAVEAVARAQLAHLDGVG